MQLQSAKQKKEASPQDFLDRCSSLAMKTVPKVEEPSLQKFHYDQAERMLPTTFRAGLSGNSGRQVRFQMPATVDQALQIAVTVYEAEAEEKRNFAFFSNSDNQSKRKSNFCQPRKTLGKSEYGQAARVTSDTPHTGRKHLQQNARPTNASSEGKMLCFKCGKPGHLARECFQINFPPIKTKERRATPNRVKR
jgi:hypothetical protein